MCRQDSIVADIASAMQQASRAAGGGKSAAAAAAQAFDDHTDYAVRAGWAYTQLLTLRSFLEVRSCNAQPVRSQVRHQPCIAASITFNLSCTRGLCMLLHPRPQSFSVRIVTL